MLGQQEGVDRHDDDILVPVHDEGRVVNLTEHREAIARRDNAPFPDRRYLGRGGLFCHRRITVCAATLEPLNIGAPRRLACLARREKCIHE